MWIHRYELPIAVTVEAPKPRLARQIEGILKTAPDKGFLAGLYLGQRHLAQEDIRDMLTGIAAEELTHADILLELLQKLKVGDECETPIPFNAFSATAPPVSAANDLISALYLDLFLEQAVRKALETLMTIIKSAEIRSTVEWILMQDIRHTRQLAEALRLSLFRYGICDPFLPGEGQSLDPPVFSLNGRAEEIEYYLDPKTGRYACRSAGKIAVH